MSHSCCHSRHEGQASVGDPGDSLGVFLGRACLFLVVLWDRMHDLVDHQIAGQSSPLAGQNSEAYPKGTGWTYFAWTASTDPGDS